MKTKPQEKAKDLVSKFGHDLALKVVTEIIIAMETFDDRNDTFELQNMEGDFRYWDQVNIELQHLRQQQDEKPTQKQLDYIESIEENTGIIFTGTTKEEASKYISANKTTQECRMSGHLLTDTN